MRHISSGRPALTGIVFTSLVALTGCGSSEGTESRGERAVALTELRGVWRQRGYARVVEITDDAARFYDVTQVSCVRSGDLSLEQAEGEYDRISGNEDRFSWYESGAFTRYELDRLAALPETCATPATDAVSTFESLWHAFAENYAYFSERGVDWAQTYSNFRPRVDETTTEEELTDTFEDMLTPLNDGHVYVFDPVKGTGFLAAGLGELWDAWAAQYPGDDFGENPLDPRGAFTTAMQEYVLDRVLSGNGSSGVYDMLHWGWLDAGVAYLDVHAMATFEAEITVPEALVLIDVAMTQAMHDLAGARSFVVDVRFNQGGMDSIGYAIASWFAAESRLVSRKRAWLGDGWGPHQDITVTPRPNAFTGPVVLLLSKNSVSAAETFAIAMRALPNVTSVGTSTYGSLSDTLVRSLPNGWIFSQSNESYESPEGEQYEVTGVPADVELEPAPQLDYTENLDATLARALELLGE